MNTPQTEEFFHMTEDSSRTMQELRKKLADFYKIKTVIDINET